ncbi:MAG TPA: ABC transporter permease [Acidobacteriaceae bacterium]
MARFRRKFSRNQLSAELSEEMQQHLEEKIEALIASGMPRQEAIHAARRAFGNATLIEQRSREVWMWPLIESIWADIKFALRQLRKSPGFTVVAILTLTLGIGANLTVFLILYGVLLRPLPFPNPQQLVRINRLYPALHDTVVPAYSGTKALFMMRASQTFESAAVYDFIPAHVNLVQANGAVPLDALRVTSSFFHVFQMEPTIGRGFRPQDMAHHAPGVVILSNATWRQRFGANPNIVGRTMTLGNEKYTIIGVANPKFQLDAKVDVWVPLQIAESPADHSNDYNFVARMKPGVARAQAEDDLKRVLLEFKNTYPDLSSQYESVRVLDLHDSLVGQVRPALEMLMGAVSLVLLIVSANILGLLLTRAVARRHEISLRVALGATGWRILRQLLVENAVLCILGGLAGILLAQFASPALMHLSPLKLPSFTTLNFDTAALAFAADLTIACALLFSLVPALESRRTQLNQSLRMNAGQAAVGRNLAQKSLVVGEVAISLMLLVAAALFLTSFSKLIHTPPGFSAENAVTFKTAFNDGPTASSAAQGQRLNMLAARLEAQPGVASAAAMRSLPTQLVPDLPFDIMGRPAGQQNSGGEADYLTITPHYFNTLRIPILEGRPFRYSDTHGSEPVVIINRQVARAYFKQQNPIGQHILIGKVMGPEFADGIREIVGVVGDTKQDGLDAPAPEILYLPEAQIPDRMTQTGIGIGLAAASWIVRTKSPHVNVVTSAHRIFMDNAHIPLLSVEPMRDVIRASVEQQRFMMLLLSIFGLTSLVLGGAGLYGVMSYTVARQTKDIGVRMALGAQRGDILRMVLQGAGFLVIAGMILGIAGSLAVAQLLRSLLFEVAPRSPLTIVAMCGVLLLTGLLAAWWPARRAASIDPMNALRGE